MQFLSLSVVSVLLLAAGLVIAFAILASPIIAAVLFVIAFGGFLVWRGYRRAEADTGRSRTARVPTTGEASADPVEDSGPATVAGKHQP
jgi:O-antigen/teichoic acid export membrane protein